MKRRKKAVRARCVDKVLRTLMEDAKMALPLKTSFKVYTLDNSFVFRTQLNLFGRMEKLEIENVATGRKHIFQYLGDE